ncbi:cutinase [Xylariales sp. PMI_506]|nr:cutinase [Xylariales sp. PMI_506]
MKLSLSVLSSLFIIPYVVASPITVEVGHVGRAIDGLHSPRGDGQDLTTRQSTSLTANEFIDDGCADVVVIFARGTAQLGNLGASPGLQLYNQIKAALGSSNVAVQGVNYDAVAHGTQPEGVDITAASNMAVLIARVSTTCPSASIVVSGYSQGAAMVHASIKRLSATVQARVNAAVTFGDTRNEQDGGEIPGFPTSKTLIICNSGDLVCDGTLTITAAHFEYGPKVPQAVSFIVSKV